MESTQNSNESHNSNESKMNKTNLSPDKKQNVNTNVEKKIRVGICAMEKKVTSKHMQDILKGLQAFDEFDIIVFSEDIIFNMDIEEWPTVDALIIFFSNGFPYNKGLKYINLRKPFLINDFEMQKIFWDRRKVYKILEENNIPTPYHIVVDRGEEINNDGEVNQKMNTSEEIENMINYYTNKKQGDRLSGLNVVKSNYNSERDSRLALRMDIVNQSNTSLPSLEEKEKESCREKDNNLSRNYSACSVEVKSEEEEKNQDNNINREDEIEKELIEYDDSIEFKGMKLTRPFVEKPCNGDDHNIYIYYPPSLGGGHKRLFRKTKNLSSLYIANEDNIRRDKSYIYEEFLQTDGFDIKVYTIGPEYAHAEARKSPSLDGKVPRSSDGKEIRYPVNLTPFEKELARKVVNIFKQNICGFDILRSSKGKSYVCDVNGWSFVKGNKKYYEDCAILIRKMILLVVDPLRYAKKPLSLKIRVPTYEELILPHRPSQNQNHAEELRSVVAVFRHADRSPKQKMKLVVNDPLILNLFKKFGKKGENGKFKEIKLKKPKELMEVLNIATTILQDNHIDEDTIYCLNDNFMNKLFQLKMVLEKNLNFQGMTRKIQLKPLKFIKGVDGKDTETVSEALFIFKWGGDITHSGIEQAKLLGNTFRVQMYPSYAGYGDGLLRLHSTYRHDLKCYSADEGRCLKTSAAFLQGLLQLEGNIIPIISSMVRKDEPVLDLLDTSLDEVSDIKAKVKEEVSECLHHDGNLLEKFKSYFKNQIIFQSKDDEQDHSLYKLMDQIKNPLEMIKKSYSLMDKLIQYIKTLLTQEELELDTDSYLIRRHALLEKRVSDSCVLTNITELKKEEIPFIPLVKPKPHQSTQSCRSSMNGDAHKQLEFDCEDEKIILIYKRWHKLYLDFYNTKTKLFDVSKIPDIYDNIKYDLIHNKSLLNDDAYNLFYYVNLLANFVMPLEYGITVDEKVRIGLKVIGPLLNKIHNDLLWWVNPNKGSSNFYTCNEYFDNENISYSGLDRGRLNANDVKSAWRHVKTRFYFTCASHLYSMINTIIFGIDSYLIDQTESNQIFIKELKNVLDLDYCSHLVFRLYENFNVEIVSINLFCF